MYSLFYKRIILIELNVSMAVHGLGNFQLLVDVTTSKLPTLPLFMF